MNSHFETDWMYSTANCKGILDGLAKSRNPAPIVRAGEGQLSRYHPGNILDAMPISPRYSGLDYAKIRQLAVLGIFFFS